MAKTECITVPILGLQAKLIAKILNFCFLRPICVWTWIQWFETSLCSSPQSTLLNFLIRDPSICNPLSSHWRFFFPVEWTETWCRFTNSNLLVNFITTQSRSCSWKVRQYGCSLMYLGSGSLLLSLLIWRSVTTLLSSNVGNGSRTGNCGLETFLGGNWGALANSGNLSFQLPWSKRSSVMRIWASVLWTTWLKLDRYRFEAWKHRKLTCISVSINISGLRALYSVWNLRLKAAT